jgi:membrane protein
VRRGWGNADTRKVKLAGIGKNFHYNSGAMEKKATPSVWALIRVTAESFGSHESALRAASLAYYGLLSLFPLALFLIYLGGRLFSSQEAREALDLFLAQALPIDTANLEVIIDQAIRVRGPIQFLGFLALVWSASAVFNVLEAGLSIAWGCDPRPFWRRRFLATISILVLCLVFIASFSLGPITNWLWSGGETLARRATNLAVGFGLSVLTAFLLFRIFPNRSVPWQPALGGALLTAALIEVSRYIFTFLLDAALINYGYVYGSLAWIVALGAWAYLVGALLFVGAEFGATLEKYYF